MKLRLPKRGAYQGRLAFDSDSGFHLAADGRRVVTLDGGQTWKYARRGDTSHFHRHHIAYAVVDTTANANEPEQHHYAVQADDPHFQGLVSDPDNLAETATSHTDAWKEQA